MWWEFMQTEIGTGREQLTKMCGYQALPIYLIEVIKASNRPAAEIGTMRAEIADNMRQVAHTIMQHPQLGRPNA